MIPEYGTFVEFVELFVIPLRHADPNPRRLDGWEVNRGNPRTIARFHHDGSRWKVHADTRYEPLLLAYEALKRGECGDPFRRTTSRRSATPRLALRDEIRQKMSDQKNEYLYIYAC